MLNTTSMSREIAMSDRFKLLSEDDALPHILKALDQTPQRTPEWWVRRRNRLSGSKLSQLLFIQSQDEMTVYREVVLGQRPRPPLDERGQKNVKWGVENEPNACATALHHLPNMRVWEVGFEQHATHSWFGSSPDGVVHWPDRGYGAMEIKCSTKLNAKGLNVPHQGVPYYYIPQLHAEMRCLPIDPCDWTLFVSWSQTKTKMYTVQFDEEYFSIMWDCMIDFMAGDVPYELWRLKRDRLADASREVARNALPLGSFESFVVGST
jgi:hypothetical protein